MMASVKDIQAPISTELQVFEKKFRNSMKSNVMLLDRIMNYIVKRKGKQLRPMFVFLTAKMCGRMNDRTYRGASLIELLHTATLVHDDVVDDASFRRGFFSVNALWKNKIAVLVGDYLLSRGLLLAVQNGDFRMLELVSGAVQEMSEGELLQIEKSRNLNMTEETYYDIIRQKTASLISSCCAVGAASVAADEEVVEQMREFGTKVGIAFQIKDDLFDYNTSQAIGKPVGIDIKEKKITLPLLHALNQASRNERKKIINIIKNQSHKPRKVKEVIAFVKSSDGIEYATTAMHRFKKEALDILSNFPPSDSRDSLQDLVEFTVERSK